MLVIIKVSDITMYNIKSRYDELQGSTTYSPVCVYLEIKKGVGFLVHPHKRQGSHLPTVLMIHIYVVHVATSQVSGELHNLIITSSTFNLQTYGLLRKRPDHFKNYCIHVHIIF